MPSRHEYTAAEFSPLAGSDVPQLVTVAGYEFRGYQRDSRSTHVVEVADDVGKDQLLAALESATPASLSVTPSEVNLVPGGDSTVVALSGMAGKAVSVSYVGAAPVQQANWVLDSEGAASVELGPAPSGMFIHSPMVLTFRYDENIGPSASLDLTLKNQ